MAPPPPAVQNTLPPAGSSPSFVHEQPPPPRPCHTSPMFHLSIPRKLSRKTYFILCMYIPVR